MVKARVAGVAAAIVACNGTVIIVDGGSDATVDAPADVAAESSPVDASDANWFAQFDVYQYDGHDPPYVGEYPLSTRQPCLGDNPLAEAGNPTICDPLAQCDTFTGWCCSGEVKSQACVCGASLGCLPPDVCCDLPDALAPSCVDGMAACPNGSRPWWP